MPPAYVWDEIEITSNEFFGPVQGNTNPSFHPRGIKIRPQKQGITDWVVLNNRIDDFDPCYDQDTPPNPIAIGILLVTQNGMLANFDPEEVEFDNVFKNSTCPAESHRVVIKATDP